MPQHHWRRIGQIWNFFDAPIHGGLSTNGEYFFFAEQDNRAYAVVDVRTGKTVWEMQRGENYPPLPEWIENGHIEILQGAAKGRYRIIGLEESYPLAVDEALGIALRLNNRSDELALIDLETQQEFKWLHYEMPTNSLNKWAIASISDDGSTIGVLVDHAVTFFRHDGSAHSETQTLTNEFFPKPLSGSLWTNIGGVQGFYEYPQHAGLSTDGRHFMFVEYSGIDYLVIDIRTQEILWRSDLMSGRKFAPELSKWIKDGFVEIEHGPAAGRYRIFGLEEGEPLLVNSIIGLSLALDTELSQLILKDMMGLQEYQRLYYRPSDDWTFASFSDDGSVIAVVANHAVTFFAPASNISGK